MTGAGYAAGMLGPNTVGTKQLKKNAVISSKVKNRSLLGVDFKAGQLPRGAQGCTGPQGPQGVQGAQGPPGPTLGVADLAGNVPACSPWLLPRQNAERDAADERQSSVMGRVRSSTTCAASSCAAVYGLTS